MGGLLNYRESLYFWMQFCTVLLYTIGRLNQIIELHIMSDSVLPESASGDCGFVSIT